jgi:hypothetical protein
VLGARQVLRQLHAPRQTAELRSDRQPNGDPYEHHVPRTHTRPAGLGHALAGIGYATDVPWGPHVSVLAGGYRLSGGTLDKSLFVVGAALELGLDYELSRNWAIGLAAQQHVLVSNPSAYPSYTIFMLRLDYGWGP